MVPLGSPQRGQFGRFGRTRTGNTPVISATHNGETITFDAPLIVGAGADGIPLIVVPSGTAEIVSRSTPAEVFMSNDIHGTMLNPVRRGTQGWDERMDNYAAGSNEAFPITITAGDIIVCCTSREVDLSDPTDLRDGAPASYAVFHVVSSLPANPARYFAPAAIGWSGRGTPTGYSVDIDTALAAIPSLNVTSLAQPTYSALMGHIGKVNPVIRYTDADTEPGMEAHMPYGFGGMSGNYGQYAASTLGSAFLLMASNAVSAAERRTLYITLLRLGIDALDPCDGDTVVASNGGAITQFQFLVEAFAAVQTGRSASLATLNSIDPQNPLRQPFKMTAGLLADLAPHSDNEKPFPWRRRTINAVAGTGPWTITLDTYRATDGDGVRMATVGYTLVRESDSASAAITGPGTNVVVPGGTSTVDVTIGTMPGSPFVATNVVYLQPPYTLVADQYDWSVLGSGTEWNTYDQHAFRANYGALNFFADDVLATRAFGLYDAAFDALEGYVCAVQAGNYPGTVAGTTLFTTQADTTNVTGAPAFTQAFWNRHATDLIPRILPVISGVATASTSDDITCDYSLNHSAGTLFALVDQNASRTAGQVEAGGGSASTSVPITASGAQTQLAFNNITPDGTYYVHLMHKKTTGQQSAVVSTSVSVSSIPFEFVTNSAESDDNAGDHVFNLGTIPAGDYIVGYLGRASSGVATEIPATLTVDGTPYSPLAGTSVSSTVRNGACAFKVTLASSYAGNWTTPASGTAGTRRYAAIGLWRIGARTVITQDTENAVAASHTLGVNTNAGDQMIFFAGQHQNAITWGSGITAGASITSALLAAAWGSRASAAGGSPENHTVTTYAFSNPVSCAIVLRI